MAKKIECDFCEEAIPEGMEFMFTAPLAYETFGELGAWDFCSETCALDFLANRAQLRETVHE